MLYQRRNRCIEEQSKIKDLKSKSTFSHLQLDRDAKNILKKTSSKNGATEKDAYTRRVKLDLYLSTLN